jgi:hypothetical protein
MSGVAGPIDAHGDLGRREQFGGTLPFVRQYLRLRLERTSINSNSNSIKEKEMADFRKWVLVLVLFVLCAGLASAADQCQAVPAQVPVIREGGLAELVGDKILSCSIAVDTTVNFQIFMTNTFVTSKFNSISRPALIVNDDKWGGGAVYRGVPAPSGPTQSIQFQNVLLPAGTNTQVRITNIRVVAPPYSPPLTWVYEMVTISPSGAIAISDLQPQVAAVQPSFVFSVNGCTGSGTPSLTFQQCISQPYPAGALHFAVKFTELFPTAFKVRGNDPVQDNPNQAPPYGTESGLTYEGTNDVTTTDVATQGTRFLVTFSNVPAGVNIWVTDRELGTVSTGNGTLVAAQALFVSGADSKGAGGTYGAASSSATQAICGETLLWGNTTTEEPPPAVPPALLVGAYGQGNTTQYAVWEVVNNNQYALDTFVFGVQVAYTANTGADLPGVTTTPGQVTGTLAPTSTDVSQSSSPPQPRFNSPVQQGTQPFQIMRCATNLLFPYVTNLGTYNTGMALVNTSKDNAGGGIPWATQTQSGPCHLYFFGNLTLAAQNTPTVAAGSLVKFTLTAPPSTFTQSTAGFEGYVIARCDFQFAHGFAFIVDQSLPGFGSESYLALVIPQGGGSSVNLTVRTPDGPGYILPGAGETLGP